MRLLAACLILLGCAPAPTPEITPATNPIPRIVSLDYCADQYVLKLVERDYIAALSPDAGKAFSYLKDDARSIPTVQSRTEDIIALRPDLIVRSYGGGANAPAFFEQLGITVLNIGWAADIDGIKSVTLDMARGLGAVDSGAIMKGEALVAQIDARLSALPDATGKTALYVTPSGVTSGSGSLVNEILHTAGYRNFETRAGWHSLPLERLTRETPDITAAAFFDTKSQKKDMWSAARHPIAKTAMQKTPSVMLDGAWLSCGAWYALDAVEALASGNAP